LGVVRDDIAKLMGRANKQPTSVDVMAICRVSINGSKVFSFVKTQSQGIGQNMLHIGLVQTSQKVEMSKETLIAAQKVKAKSTKAIKNERARGFGFTGLSEVFVWSFIYHCRYFVAVLHS
jgi:hypothetical protein